MGFIEMALDEMQEHIRMTINCMDDVENEVNIADPPIMTISVAAYDALIHAVKHMIAHQHTLMDEVRHLKAMVPPYGVTMEEAIEAMQLAARAGTTTIAEYLVYQQRARSKEGMPANG